MVDKLGIEIEIDSSKLEAQLSKAFSNAMKSGGGSSTGSIAGGVALGGGALELGKAIAGGLVTSSPLLQATLVNFQTISRLVLMPLGDMIANRLDPLFGMILKNWDIIEKMVKGVGAAFSGDGFFEALFSGIGRIGGTLTGIIGASIGNAVFSIIRYLDVLKVTDVGKMSDEEFSSFKPENITSSAESFGKLGELFGSGVGQFLDDIIEAALDMTGISDTMKDIASSASGDADSFDANIGKATETGVDGIKAMGTEMDSVISKARILQCVLNNQQGGILQRILNNQQGGPQSQSNTDGNNQGFSDGSANTVVTEDIQPDGTNIWRLATIEELIPSLFL